MKVVKVYGALRKRLGQCRFELEAATPAQAIKALCVNFPGLDKWLIDSEKDGVGYRVTVSKEKATEQDVSPLIMPWSEKDVFSITPVIAGAGRGLGSILVGVALVGLAVASGGATLGLTGFTSGAVIGVSSQTAILGGALAAAAGNIGIGLGFMGIAQTLSPQPSFSNVVNTSKQGLPVPIAYGRVFVGSAIISSGLDVDEVRA